MLSFFEVKSLLINH